MVDNAPRDPFIEKFLSRLAPQVAATFTSTQLAAVKIAFGGKPWGTHPIDIRTSFPWFRRRYYVVFIAGPERRSPDRRVLDRPSHPLSSLGNGVITAIFLALISIPLIAALYAVKSTLGISFDSGVGGPGLLQELLDQLGQLFK